MKSLTQVPIQIKYEITLPKINFKKNKTSRVLQKQNKLEPTIQQAKEELSKLDEWANSLPTIKRKRNQTSQSIMFLYKSHNKYNLTNSRSNRLQQARNGLISAAGLYLAQLDSELNKIKKINYDAIFQNVQYCAGVYQIAFNDIFKKLDSIKINLQEHLSAKLKKIDEDHQKVINQIKVQKQNSVHTDNRSSYEKSHYSKQLSEQADSDLKENQNSNAIQLSKRDKPHNKLNCTFRDVELNKSASMRPQIDKGKMLLNFKEIIQEKQKQLKPIKLMLEKVEKARIKVLHFSLQLGYDIKQEGLIWILREFNDKNTSVNKKNDEQIDKQNTSRIMRLKSMQKQIQYEIPKVSSFPNFLTQQQINFVISKYKNNFKLKIIQEEKQEKQSQEKVILQNAFQNVRRDRNRKLSMIKQKQLFEKLLNKRKQQIATGHKYISSETIKLMQNSQKIKATKNELIYQQTIRKLNKFCVQQIYSKKSKANESNQNAVNASKSGNNEQVHRLMDELKKMLSQTNKLQDREEQIKSEQEKQLSDILMKLRNQRYEGRICSERRNPISVIACLVGWRKAKKILENQMNISMPAS